MSIFEKLLSSEFMPHGMCYMWKPELLWLHVISDGLIFVSYISIPICLVYILKQRSDLIFSKVMVLFGAFVLLCGITHAIAVWTVWNGTYWFSGSVKALTAIVSVATAVMLWVLIPTLKSIPTVKELEDEVENRKKAEEALKEQSHLLELKTQELKRSNAELESFAYVASHDLKSPINGIKKIAGWIKEDLMDDDIPISDRTKQHFEHLDTRIVRINNLLSGLLEYAKIGAIEEKLSQINTSEVFAELFELLGKGKKMQLHMPENSFTITTLASPFHQVMRNLIDNAIKHHSEESGNVWIEISDSDEFLEVKIKDDGEGVAEKHLEKITEMFSTLKSRDEVEGSGIGLALIKKIMLNVGGKLAFDSDIGKGMTVIIHWPKQIQVPQ
ncbi:sensor histidine kinase [Aliikangiella sp. IMCC44632]